MVKLCILIINNTFLQKQKISEKLSRLVNYIEAVSFPGFNSAPGGTPTGKFYQMSSFGERKAFKYINDPETSVDFVKYNSRQLSRIYPSGARQDSSNFNPLTPWNAGCQLGKFCNMSINITYRYFSFDFIEK